MGKYYLHREGKLYAVGECPDGMEELQAVSGFEVGVGDPPQHLVADTRLPPKTYDVLRRGEYPPIGDQLDAIWKVIASLGTDMGDAREVLSRIQEVKVKYPKMPNSG